MKLINRNAATLPAYTAPADPPPPQPGAGYGKLYDWHAVSSPNGLAPTGWSIPTLQQIEQFHSYILTKPGITVQNAGNHLKGCRMVNHPAGGYCDTSDHPRWENSSETPNNALGFQAYPAGARNITGSSGLGTLALFWTATQRTDDSAYQFGMNSTHGRLMTLIPGASKKNGASVRCIQAKAPGESDGATGTLQDIDGNTYQWVVIGAHRWMTTNLITTRYRNGTAIQHTNNAWIDLHLHRTPGYGGIVLRTAISDLLLVVATQDAGTRRWSTQGFGVYGLSGDSGRAYSNTQKIIDRATPPTAAHLAREQTHSNYGDWSLPAPNDLVLISQNRNHIPGLTTTGDFPAASYWSSSQRDNSFAYYNTMGDPLHQIRHARKDEVLRVRPVRYVWRWGRGADDNVAGVFGHYNDNPAWE